MNVIANLGVTPANLSDGTNGGGVPADPKVVNTPPPAVLTPEQIAANEKAAGEAHAIQVQQQNEANEEDARVAQAEEAKLYDYATNGDEAHDATIAFLRENKVTKTDAELIFKAALTDGDLSKIDLKALKAKLGGSDTKVATVMALVKAYHSNATAAAQGILKGVHEVVGGKEAWDTVAGWARGNTDPKFVAELAELRPLINKGGAAGKAAVKELVALYNADPNTKGLKNGAVSTAGTKHGSSAGEPLSRAEYAKAVQNAEYDRSLTAVAKQQKLANLSARRAAGRAAGI